MKCVFRKQYYNVKQKLLQFFSHMTSSRYRKANLENSSQNNNTNNKYMKIIHFSDTCTCCSIQFCQVLDCKGDLRGKKQVEKLKERVSVIFH